MAEFFPLSVERLVSAHMIGRVSILHNAHDGGFDTNNARVIVLLLSLASLPVTLDLVPAADYTNLDFYEIALEAFVEEELVRGLDIFTHGLLD
jgi:hypothetical protein